MTLGDSRVELILLGTRTREEPARGGCRERETGGCPAFWFSDDENACSIDGGDDTVPIADS